MTIDKQKLRDLCERADDCSLNLVEWNELSSSVPDLLDRIDELEEKFEAADAVAGDNNAALVEVTNENRRLLAALTKSESILARNLGHQTEKCYDALKIIRGALFPSSREPTASKSELEAQSRGVDDAMVERAAKIICCPNGCVAIHEELPCHSYQVEAVARHALEAALAVPAQQWRPISEEQIKHMVDRFLQWRLPKDFNPDAGISYTRPNYAPEVDATPNGTNLLDAAQATEMVRFMIEALPAPPAQEQE